MFNLSHEIVGTPKEVGSNVQCFKIGDHDEVGTYVNSCRECEYCDDGLKAYCSNGAVFTFDNIDADGSITDGGYSTYIIVLLQNTRELPTSPGSTFAMRWNYCLLSHDAPKDEPASKSLGEIGLGGLGHLAVKFGKSFGLKVTVFSTNISKKDKALNLLGADKFVVSSDKQQMAALAKSLDFILNTASADIPFNPYLSVVKTAGVLALVEFPSEVKFSPASFNRGMKTVSGSVTGDTKETQEMLDFCASSKIYPEIEFVPIQYANGALERMIKRDVKYWFVIDIENSLKRHGCRRKKGFEFWQFILEHVDICKWRTFILF
ncbi:hypothetical protein RJ639_026308 [Escallonia herrerae]|uniref:Alcohol dehydrogenase n=1 Tax=Escallonia herrerae TaxID=1293975 RepID=A0AA88RV35_9ASTE|nr:hypothetical protein RJ639_026308 [Escallonia herrerae]